MMKRPRYLTKSRYKLGIECPTKLFYTGKAEYSDQRDCNPFLAALAEGGFKVVELARQYYRGGVVIETLDYNEALAMTQDLMRQDRVIIFEPAFLYKTSRSTRAENPTRVSSSSSHTTLYMKMGR